MYCKLLDPPLRESFYQIAMKRQQLLQPTESCQHSVVTEVDASTSREHQSEMFLTEDFIHDLPNVQHSVSATTLQNIAPDNTEGTPNAAICSVSPKSSCVTGEEASSSRHHQDESSQTEEDHLSDETTQTAGSLSAHTPRKRALTRYLKTARKQNARLRKRLYSSSSASDLDRITKEEFLYLAKRFLPEQCLGFIESQIGLTSHLRGNRYSAELKRFALILYFLSPKSYAFLRKTFCLPSKNVLHRQVGKFPLTAGLNECLFHLLQYKFRKLTALQKHCTLCIDEISLKSHLFYDRKSDHILGLEDLGNNKRSTKVVKSALVLMIKSICGGWKQPISFYFLASSCPATEVERIVKEVISKLGEIGIEINCLVSDQGSNFKQFMTQLGVTVEKPYFEYEDNKIFAFFNICHLIKSLRNNLIKYIFVMDGTTDVSWDHIRTMYNDLKERNLRLCPKLTEKHMNPSNLNFQKMKVKLATQVFSHTVAAALKSYVSFKMLPPSAEGTANFVEHINHLFDMFNTTKLHGPSCYKRAFQAEAGQMTFLEHCTTLFKKLKVVTKVGRTDVTNSLKCISGLLQSVTALPLLFAHLKERGVKFLCTQRLNQDCLENFFGTIRQQSGNSYNPTPIQFQRAFKKLLLLDFFSHSETYNCADDDFELLDMNSHSMNALPTVPLIFNDDQSVRPLIMPQLPVDITDLPKANCLLYICGYTSIYKKCLEKHRCDLCTSYGQSGQIVGGKGVFCSLKAYRTLKRPLGNLQRPPDAFVSMVTTLENAFVQFFDPALSKPQFADFIMQKVEAVTFQHPCTQFPLEYAKKLFIRMRIFYALKFFNHDVLSAQTSSKQKLLILKHL